MNSKVLKRKKYDKFFRQSKFKSKKREKINKSLDNIKNSYRKSFYNYEYDNKSDIDEEINRNETNKIKIKNVDLNH